MESTVGNRCRSRLLVTLSSCWSVAVMFSPAMVPMPFAEGITSSGVMRWPSVRAVAVRLRQWPANLMT